MTALTSVATHAGVDLQRCCSRGRRIRRSTRRARSPPRGHVHSGRGASRALLHTTGRQGCWPLSSWAAHRDGARIPLQRTRARMRNGRLGTRRGRCSCSGSAAATRRRLSQPNRPHISTRRLRPAQERTGTRRGRCSRAHTWGRRTRVPSSRARTHTAPRCTHHGRGSCEGMA